MGANFFDCEKPGMGQTAKIANNLALAIQMQSIVEAMIYGKNIRSKQVNLCKTKTEKKDKFKKGSIDRFVLEVRCTSLLYLTQLHVCYCDSSRMSAVKSKKSDLVMIMKASAPVGTSTR